ncbi:hypothetical protein [Rhizobium chutanense]|nr:hypothetical protein [Rhizobium chutanense]
MQSVGGIEERPHQPAERRAGKQCNPEQPELPARSGKLQRFFIDAIISSG